MSAARRPAVPGFGALFVLGVVKALADVPPLSAAELLVPSTPAPTAPTWCPCCCFPVVAPSRDDESGEWTWNCFGGCNP